MKRKLTHQLCSKTCSKKQMHLMKTPEERAAILLKSGTTAKRRYANGEIKIWNKGKEWSEEIKKKLSDAHKKSGHRPITRGGNGKIARCEQLMLEMLSDEWKMQCVIPTKMPRGSGYPTCYKVDFGIYSKKIAIEVDGNSHRLRKRQDEKKDTFLQQLGWTILRISNVKVEEQYTIWKQTGLTITLPKGF
jgi:hypothetical protein